MSLLLNSAFQVGGGAFTCVDGTAVPERIAGGIPYGSLQPYAVMREPVPSLTTPASATHTCHWQ